MKLHILLLSLPMLAASSFTAFNSNSLDSPNHLGRGNAAAEVLKVAAPAAAPVAQRRPAIAYSYVVDGQRYNVLKSAQGYNKEGTVSWYGPGFQKRLTSSGTIYNMYAMTAASKVLPLNTYVKVTDLTNHRWVVVKVTDRGPFVKGRIMDLSYAAAKQLNMINNGTAQADVQAIPTPSRLV